MSGWQGAASVRRVAATLLVIAVVIGAAVLGWTLMHAEKQLAPGRYVDMMVGNGDGHSSDRLNVFRFQDPETTDVKVVVALPDKKTRFAVGGRDLSWPEFVEAYARDCDVADLEVGPGGRLVSINGRSTAIGATVHSRRLE